jgi:multidrug efflux pump subunit AcrB
VRLVQVKMLPFDNKSEFQVILDLPEGTTLETTHAAAQDIARYLHTCRRWRSTQVYAGTAAPFNFNGLVRHYFMRRGANVADVQVNLSREAPPQAGRATTSRWRCARASSHRRGYGARAKIAEIPPGPPVLSTLVAEVYAADDATRLAAARR